MRVVRDGRVVQEAVVTGSDDLWRPKEILWAPDATAFAINGSASAFAGFDVLIYRIRADGVVRVRVTAQAQADMVGAFPPCRASGLALPDCRTIASDPGFNMSVLTWTRGSSAVVVFAEVPCNSRYGGIMCQVQGYELDVPSGRILRRMTARDTKRRYQWAAAWPISIPDPPDYVRAPR